MHGEILSSLDTKDRIPLGEVHHGFVYNFWQDADHVRGLWRRIAVAEYEHGSRMGRAADVEMRCDTHKDWVFQGANCTPDEELPRRPVARRRRCFGVLEYDPAPSFPKNGFRWRSRSRTRAYSTRNGAVRHGFRAGTMTESSYPRIVKLWRRGTPSRPRLCLKARSTTWPRRRGVPRALRRRPLIGRGLTFFTSEFISCSRRQDAETAPAAWRQVARRHGRQLLFTSRDAWTKGRTSDSARSLWLSMCGFRQRRSAANYDCSMRRDRGTVEDVATGHDAVYAAIFENITGSIHAFRPGRKGEWSDTVLPSRPGASTRRSDADGWSGEAYFTYESFLVPPTLYADDGRRHARDQIAEAVYSMRAGYVAEQFWATSNDGTKIPYFLCMRRLPRARSPRSFIPMAASSCRCFPGTGTTAIARSMRDRPGWRAAAPSRSPISVAAANSVRPGTKRRSNIIISAPSTISRPWRRT